MELNETGSVRVIVVVNMAGLSQDQYAANLQEPTTRAQTKAQIAAAIDAVISSHGLAAAAPVKGSPAITRLTSAPAFGVTVNASQLAKLGADPAVVSINHDMKAKPHLSVTVPFISLPGGGTGTGYTVAVIDTGVQRNHLFLGTPRLFTGREACFLDTNDCPNGTNTQIGTGAGEAAPNQPHGTHVAGIVLGNRASGTPSRGVANAAKLIPINIFGPNTSVSFSTIQRAFEHVEDLVYESNGSNPLNIASINMSVGGSASFGNCDADSPMDLLKPVILSLRAKNVLSVISAGNDSKVDRMSYPACLSTMVSVAATNRSGVVASYTNISPTTDLFAPGGDFANSDCVVSSVPTDNFAAFCGTSMAAPHVAGAIAVLRQKKPTATACEIEDALRVTGLATADTRVAGTLSKGRIRVSTALTRLNNPVVSSNDNFANALTIPSSQSLWSSFKSNAGASMESGEPTHGFPAMVSTLWYKLTPPRTSVVTIDTIGSSVDTLITVYSDAVSASNPGTIVTRSDNLTGVTGAKESSVRFIARQGTTYHIVAGSKNSTQTCGIQLNMTQAPSNDNFTGQIYVPVKSNTTVETRTGFNYLATKETGEPDHNGRAANTSSVWYWFTAPYNGAMVIDTLSTEGLDTVLSVYTGSAVSALTPVASNDDAVGLLSRVQFNMIAGTKYRVAVVGFNGAVGNFKVNFRPGGAGSVVAADNAARRAASN